MNVISKLIGITIPNAKTYLIILRNYVVQMLNKIVFQNNLSYKSAHVWNINFLRIPHLKILNQIDQFYVNSLHLVLLHCLTDIFH